SDSIKVVNARFHQSQEPAAAQEPADWSRYLAVARHLSLGVTAVCALIVLRIFSRARQAVASPSPEQLPAPAASAGLLPAADATLEPALVRQQIAHALKQNPEQVRQMFLNWIQQKE
ncbi:MAG: hypothetical protein MUC88_17435, partial [Planctomycetes bacterium]|nr:hypothetical protein [Planctomycetota bacterium]